MNWLLISCFLTFGYMPENVVTIDDVYGPFHLTAVADNPCSFEQTIGISATAFSAVTLWTEIETFDMISAEGFKPFRSDYRIGLKAFKGPVEVGITHECDHPVIFSMDGQILGYGANKTELYVKFSGEKRY